MPQMSQNIPFVLHVFPYRVYSQGEKCSLHVEAQKNILTAFQIFHFQTMG